MIRSSRNYKSHWHCVYHLKYHLVLVTKYRHKCFTLEIFQRLKELCTEQAAHWEIELIEFGGEEDHIHRRFIGSVKNVTSRLIQKEFSEHMSQFYGKPVLWTRAYCLVTEGGDPLEILKHYIQTQDQPKT